MLSDDHTTAALHALESSPTISVDQYAHLVGVSRTATYDHVKAGNIPSIRVGRRVRIPSAFVKNQLEPTASGGALTS